MKNALYSNKLAKMFEDLSSVESLVDFFSLERTLSSIDKVYRKERDYLYKFAPHLLKRQDKNEQEDYIPGIEQENSGGKTSKVNEKSAMKSLDLGFLHKAAEKEIKIRNEGVFKNECDRISKETSSLNKIKQQGKAALNNINQILRETKNKNKNMKNVNVAKMFPSFDKNPLIKSKLKFATPKMNSTARSINSFARMTTAATRQPSNEGYSPARDRRIFDYLAQFGNEAASSELTPRIPKCFQNKNINSANITKNNKTEYSRNNFQIKDPTPIPNFFSTKRNTKKLLLQIDPYLSEDSLQIKKDSSETEINYRLTQKEIIKKNCQNLVESIEAIKSEYEQMDKETLLNSGKINLCNLNRILRLRNIIKNKSNHNSEDFISESVSQYKERVQRDNNTLIKTLDKLGPPSFVKNKFKNSTIKKFKNTSTKV